MSRVKRYNFEKFSRFLDGLYISPDYPSTGYKNTIITYVSFDKNTRSLLFNLTVNYLESVNITKFKQVEKQVQIVEQVAVPVKKEVIVTEQIIKGDLPYCTASPKKYGPVYVTCCNGKPKELPIEPNVPANRFVKPLPIPKQSGGTNIAKKTFFNGGGENVQACNPPCDPGTECIGGLCLK